MVVLTGRSLGLEIGFPLAIVLLLGINLALVFLFDAGGSGRLRGRRHAGALGGRVQ